MKKIFFIVLMLCNAAHATMLDTNTYIPYDISNPEENYILRNTRQGYLQDIGGIATRLWTPEASDSSRRHMRFDTGGSWATRGSKVLNANWQPLVPFTGEFEAEPLPFQREESALEFGEELQRLQPKIRGDYNRGL